MKFGGVCWDVVDDGWDVGECGWGVGDVVRRVGDPEWDV